MPSKFPFPSNYQDRDNQHSNEEMKKDHGKIFSSLNINDYTEVKPSNFEEYLSVISYHKPGSSTLEEHKHLVTDKATIKIKDYQEETVKESDETPAKKTKIDNSSSGNVDTSSCHTDSDITSESEDSYQGDVITRVLLTKCVTHPRVINLISDLLKDKMNIKS